jgi:uncharacterized membrane protein YtjA (UPF0391 family)
MKATQIYSGKQVPYTLRMAVLFLIIAIIAGVFGFFGIVTAAIGIAKILFVCF